MLKISRILHAGYLFESEKAKIAFDPLFETPFSVNCYAFPAVSFDYAAIRSLELDAVFISHFHDDHFSMESLDQLNRTTPIYMFTVFPELLDLIRELGFDKVYALSLNVPVRIKDILVTPRKALDENVDSLFQIQSQGLNILNVVDSWIDDETLELLKNEPPWDLVMWPFQTMRELEMIAPTRHQSLPPEIPAEWRSQLETLQPKNLIPSSCQFKMEPWSWYNNYFFPISYEFFQKEISRTLPLTDIFRLNPGESLLVESHEMSRADRLSWIKMEEDPQADYIFDLKSPIPSTAEVAQHFPVSDIERQRVLDFCKFELIKAYEKLKYDSHDYFLEDGVWELNIFEPEREHRFLFHFFEGAVVICDGSEAPVFWKTEIPLKKLYGALETGESLSSLYIRINAQKFSEKHERRLKDVEVTEDPLLRALYQDSLGSYQRAQLLRIKV